MSIAYTNHDIILEQAVDGSSAAALIAGIRSAINSQGDWEDEVAITGGYEWTVVSPQLLAAKFRIWNPGGGATYIYAQMRSEDGGVLGYQHRLAFEVDKLFQIWVNQCSIFISVEGVSDDPNPVNPTPRNAMSAGIPFVPWDEIESVAENECGDLRPTGFTNECWWSCGDADDGPFGYRHHFRDAYICTGAWSAVRNATLISPATIAGGVHGVASYLRIVPVTPAGVGVPYGFSYGGGNPPATEYANSEEPLFFDPLIGWGELANSYDISPSMRVRGQLYDAMICSHDVPIDQQWEPFPILFPGEAWICYGHSTSNLLGAGTFYCSLHLLLDQPATMEIANVAY